MAAARANGPQERHAHREALRPLRPERLLDLELDPLERLSGEREPLLRERDGEGLRAMAPRRPGTPLLHNSLRALDDEPTCVEMMGQR